MEDALATEQAEQVEELDPKGKTDPKGKKTKWTKAALIDFWEPAPYVPERKGQPPNGSRPDQTREAQCSKGGKIEKGGRKAGKGREKGKRSDENEGRGKRGANVPPDHTETPDSDLMLPKRGDGAYVPPLPTTSVREGLGEKFTMKGRREGGKRGGRGVDGKGGTGGRFNWVGDGCGRKSGGTNGQSYEGASDVRGNASAQVTQDGRMPGKGGDSVPAPNFCRSLPLGAALLPTTGPGGQGVAALPGAPMPFATGFSAVPTFGSSAMPAAYAMPYLVMPATVAGYPFCPAASTMGAAVPISSVAAAMSPQDGGAVPLPSNMESIPFSTPAAAVTSGGDAMNKVMQQVEYYFSTENLLKDMYLRMQMNERGWVAIRLIANFPSIKNLTSDQGMVAAAVAASSCLELDPTKTKVRVKSDWGRWPLITASS